MLVESCASSSLNLKPVSSSAPVNDVFPLLYQPVSGSPYMALCMKESSFGDLLAGIEMEKLDCKLQAARAEVAQKIAEKQVKNISSGSSSLEWRAVWGPVIGFIAGALTAGSVAAGIAALVR